MTNKDDELLPCPKCLEGVDYDFPTKNSIRIKCKCGIQYIQKFLLISKEELLTAMIKTWNTRSGYSKPKVDNGLKEILENFYFHATGSKDFGCKSCQETLAEISSLYIRRDKVVAWAKDHYWDSLERERGIIIKHIDDNFSANAKDIIKMGE